jgi:hypothetical protein
LRRRIKNDQRLLGWAKSVRGTLLRLKGQGTPELAPTDKD